MDDLITKKQAVSRMNDLLVLELKMTRLPTWNEVYNAIEELPSAQKKGHWIQCKSTNNRDVVKCSNCLHTQEICGIKNYCAVCGADMMGGDDDGCT